MEKGDPQLRPANGPLVTIGMPVWNGSNFMREAIESLLAQTYRGFELVISDNASTDRTHDIAQEYAARDSRVRVVRHAVNIGACPNFNGLVRACRTRYFKWAAHDDVAAPEYLERCVGLLEGDPSMVLAHTRTNEIDALGEVVGEPYYEKGVANDRTSERFRGVLGMGYPTIVWGVMRTAGLKRTALLADFVGSDRYFLAELMLHGRLGVVPEMLFSLRSHEEQFATKFYKRTWRENLAWFNPAAKRGGIGSATRLTARMAGVILRAPISISEKWACLGVLSQRVGKKARKMAGPSMDERHAAGETSVGSTATRVTGAKS